MNRKLLISKSSLFFYFEKLIYFIIGFIAFSRLSYFILVIKLGLPFYLPELLLIPLILICWNKIKKSLIEILYKRYLFMFYYTSLSFILIFIFIPILFNENYNFILSMGRNVLYIIIFAFIFSRFENVSYNFLFYITFGAAVGELVNSIYYLSLYNISMDNWKNVSGTNIFAVFLFISLPIIYKKSIIIQIITGIIFVQLVIGSGYRIIFLAGIFSFLFSHLYIFITSKQKNIKKIISLVIIVFLLFGFFSIVFNNKELSNKKRFRIFNRTMSLLKGDIEASQDLRRWEKISWTWEQIDNKVFPHGFIPAEGSWDIPIVYLYTVFGSIFTWILILLIIFKGLNLLLYNLRTGCLDTDASISLSVILVGLLFFLNGRFLHITYESWLFGIILGRWFSRKSFNKFSLTQLSEFHKK